ncbi:DUF916 and DUF3324 domain-containing protein [Halobacillus yeomjeoni]|uniref:DUF916 domain-containing protein n=1 Tax=Halobacillus yeomjeoni TaxID=311194 RepID=UPI001CD32691|nr:DUF916 domain-containing protein [Halobacillus yeomjeoni]MCA0984254.1 DUF916 and DUF3324 domain-containing protein [Halobacillus yeomjeoni]
MDRWKSLLFIAFFACFLSFGSTVSANNLPPIYVEPLYPDNQNPDVRGYLDLDVQPGDTQTVIFRVTNNDEESLTVTIQSANAYTHPTGGIIYSDDLTGEESSIIDDRFKIADLIHTPSTITLAPDETDEVPVTLHIPDMDNGEVIGGVRFIVDGDTTEQNYTISENQDATFKIKTQIATNIGIRLAFPESAEPDFSFGEAGFSDEKNAAFIEMTNSGPTIQPDLHISYDILTDTGESVFTGSIESLKMAPKTSITFPIPWEADPIEDGTYTLQMTADNDGEKIEAERSIQIGQSSPPENEEPNEPPKDPEQPDEEKDKFTQFQVTILIIGGILVAIAGIYFIVNLFRNRHDR